MHTNKSAKYEILKFYTFSDWNFYCFLSIFFLYATKLLTKDSKSYWIFTLLFVNFKIKSFQYKYKNLQFTYFSNLDWHEITFSNQLSFIIILNSVSYLYSVPLQIANRKSFLLIRSFIKKKSQKLKFFKRIFQAIHLTTLD